ncbi:TPA: hypothetical protein QCR55_000930 [Bacillus cereus]|nr:hypothetical protein [Bacillus cereus]HDR4877701.1 hypothetical protein [Bacillus cereus]
MKTKNQWNKEGLIYGIGGGVLGSMLTASGIVLISAFEGPVITNTVTLTAGLGGGIISGVLTLFGVRRTIDLQKEKERKDSIPQKILFLHKLRKSINECRDNIIDLKVAAEKLEVQKKTEESQMKLQKLESKLIEESLRTSSEVYKATFKFVEMMSLYRDSVRRAFLDYSLSDTQEERDKSVNSINKSYGLLVKEIEELKEMVSQALNEFEEEMFT